MLILGREENRSTQKNTLEARAVARTLIGGGGGGLYIHIYSGSAQLVSFEIQLISKDVSRA